MKKEFGFNPWWHMWIKPRQTIRAIISSKENYGFIWLSFFYGLVQGVHLAQGLSLGVVWPLWLLIVLDLFLAIPIGVIAFTILSLLLHWTGKLIKGKATYSKIRAAVAWSNVTEMMSVILVALMVLTFGSTFFLGNFADMFLGGGVGAVVFAFFLIEAVLSVWKLVIFILALAEVQEFSGWKALLNVVLVVVIYFILFFLLDALLGCSSGQKIGLFTR